LSNLEDIPIIREFQNNDSIPLKKIKCPHGTLLTVGFDEKENAILYCTCCRMTMTPGTIVINMMKEAVEKYGTSEELH
jgi:hypothetical protein